MKIIVLSIFLILFLFNSIVFSQEKEPSGLVLEVTFDDPNIPPRKIVPRLDKVSGVWFSKFPRLTEAERKYTTSEWVRAVDFLAKVEDGIIKLNVSVYIGERHFDDKKLIASYSLKPNDKIIVKKLEKFGVKPIKVAVVKVSPTVSTIPTVINKAESLQVFTEPIYSNLPSFKSKIVNNSGKPVKALSIKVKIGNKALAVVTPRNLDGRDLIKVGETYERSFRNDYERYIESRQPTAADSREYTFNVITAVFSDGSFEGDVRDAKRILGYYQSEQIFIRRALQILNELSNENDVEKISIALSNINTKIDYSNLQNLYNRYPDIFIKNNPQTLRYLQASVGSYKRRLIIEFNQFRRNKNTSFDAKGWLENTINRLNAQLKRIDFTS